MLLFALLSLLGGCSSPPGKYPLSDHYDGEKFHNLGKNDNLKSIWQLFKWQIYGDKEPFPDSVPIKNYPLRLLEASEKISVTFINHASLLLQLPGLNILTDPVYSERTSPFSFIGPKRVKKPGIPFETLPKIDVVVVSHNHYDHLDVRTLQRLEKKFNPLFLVPLGDERLLKMAQIKNVRAVDWWEEVRIKDTKFIFSPAQHWSSRTPWDKNESLWGSFMIDNGVQRIYHGGDTGYGPHFKLIKERLGAPDLALLPIGAYEPRWFMKHHHMNPEESVLAHLDLGAKKSIGMHFGTWQLTDEGIDDPLKDLVQARLKLKIKDEDFIVLDHGEALSY